MWDNGQTYKQRELKSGNSSHVLDAKTYNAASETNCTTSTRHKNGPHKSCDVNWSQKKIQIWAIKT
jgi:hypothetical protein